MADPITWTLIAGVATQASITGYQIKSGMDARTEAKDEAGRQERAANKAIADAQAEQDKQKQLEADTLAKADAKEAAVAAQLAAKKIKNSMASTSRSGRAGTILTSPLGIVGGGNTGGRKSLLGQ